jgi:PDZ domain-containing protein
VLAVLLVALARAPVPFHRLGGTTRPAADLVAVSGVPVDPAAGVLLVTIVTSEPMTVSGALGAWLRHSPDVQHDTDPVSARTFDAANRTLMARAGSTATRVALAHLGLTRDAVRVEVTPHGLGGPSAGLAMALEVVDLLTPGDLMHGHRVAVSGGLEEDGRLDPVGGIRYKARAAARAGADVMLVPPGLATEAARYAGPVRIVAVASFEDALAALEAM